MNSRYLLLALVLVVAPGCESIWMNQGKLASVMAAGQVGMFRRQTGEWPQSTTQLVNHGCRELDEATYMSEASIEPLEPAGPGCQFFLRLPYKIEIAPHAANVRLVLRDPAGKIVCNLLVIVPASHGRDTLSPQIRMRTTMFGCPGEGKPW